MQGFARLAGQMVVVLLLLFDLLGRLSVSHGDLLLVQCQGMRRQRCLGTPTEVSALNGGLWHLGGRQVKVNITPQSVALSVLRVSAS